MSSHMQSLPTPYIEETGIMSPSTGYFPNTGDTDHMSTIPSPQDFNVDFNDLILWTHIPRADSLFVPFDPFAILCYRVYLAIHAWNNKFCVFRTLDIFCDFFFQ